jgi:DnaJ-class molecular chaperone
VFVVAVDPYRTLGVARGSSLADVKAAYRRLAKSCHPDARPGDAAAAARFQEVTAAYEAIAAMSKARGAPAARSRVRVRAPRRGDDRALRIEISVEEAVTGASRRVAMGGNATAIARIPPGAEHGARLRLPGLGEPGRDGGPAGDALVTIAVRPHPVFRLDRGDVHLMLEASPRRLAVGGHVETPTPHGAVRVRVPEGARPGQVLRLKGKGLPARAGRKPGDLFITLKAADAGRGGHDARAFAAQWISQPAA